MHWDPRAFALGPTALTALGVLGVIAVVAVPAVFWYAFSVHMNAYRLAHPPVQFALWVQGAIDAGVAVFLALILPWTARRPLHELGFRPLTAGDVGVAALGAIAMLILANGTAALLESLLHVKHQQDVVKLFENVRDPQTKVLIATFAVVVGPIAEEMLFRVFVFNAGRRYLGFWGGAAISGVLFGLAHGDPVFVLPLALGGIVLCGVYARTNNAWSSMITHGLFNAVSVGLLFFGPPALR